MLLRHNFRMPSGDMYKVPCNYSMHEPVSFHSVKGIYFVPGKLNNENYVRTQLLAPATYAGSTAKQKQNVMSHTKIELLNPDGLHKNPAYSQVAVIEGNYRTVYIGGQNAVDKDGSLIGKGDMEVQAKQVLQNFEIALQAGGASFENIIKWNVYLVQGQSAEKAFKVFQGAVSKLKKAPLITGVFVAGLANPDFLLEMDAIAVVPVK